MNLIFIIRIIRDSLKETVFLLSGNDHKIHMFCEVRVIDNRSIFNVIKQLLDICTIVY